MKPAKRLYEILISLKLAVSVLIILTFSLATATVLESIYDTPTAQYWVYRSFWFHSLLGMLAINIFSVAMSRLPWKKRHVPFLLAHAGILILLFGSWVTDRYGLDGSLRITEGDTASVVEVNSPILVFIEGDQIRTVPVKWIPPHVHFNPLVFDSDGVKIDQFLPHAELETSFIQSQQESPPAIHFQLKGGPMKISQSFWLWGGSTEWSSIQAGPAKFRFGEWGQEKSAGPVFTFQLNNNKIEYTSLSSAGKTIKGQFPQNRIKGQVIDTGWKGGLTITVLDWIPKAEMKTTYSPSTVEYGDQAPPSAIHVVTPQKEAWLGLGDRMSFTQSGKEIGLAYTLKKLVLPFGIKLKEFRVDHNPGTNDPAGYSSLVVVKGVEVVDENSEKPFLIAMNEPLQEGGITFYQASFEDAEPRPITTILSVNRDPGRWLKYLGSILLVLGTISLFVVKYLGKKKQFEVVK